MRRRRKSIPSIGALVLALVVSGIYWATLPPPPVRNLVELTDPAKLDTLRGNRAANSRLLKCVYWLHETREAGISPEKAIAQALRENHTNLARARLVERSLLRNLKIAEELGCLTAENLDRMRRGASPTVTRGPYAGQPAEVDHIIPVAVAPQWGNELANLELLPRELNRRKGAKMTSRQKSLQREFEAAGL